MLDADTILEARSNAIQSHLPSMPRSFVFAEMYGQRPTLITAMETADVGWNVCIWVVDLQQWYLITKDQTHALPPFSIEQMSPDAVSHSPMWLREDMSFHLQFLLPSRSFGQSFLTIQNTEVEHKNKYPPEGVTVATYLEQTMDAIRGVAECTNRSYVLQKLRLGYHNLQTHIPEALANNMADKHYVRVIWGDWVRCMSKQVLDAVEKLGVHESVVVIGILALLDTLLQLADHKKDASMLANESWRPAGELIFPGWFEASILKPERRRRQEQKLQQYLLMDRVGKKRIISEQKEDRLRKRIRES